MKFSQLIVFLGLSFCAFPLLAESTQLHEKVSLQLKWLHAFQFAGYYAAKEKGFYAAEGLDVEIQPHRLNVDNVEQVLKGQSQYGVGDSGLLQQRLNGKPLVILAAIFQHNPLVYLTLKSSGIRSPYELKGKRIMDHLYDRASLLAMFYEAGMSPQDILHVKYDLKVVDALKSGKADAVVAYLTDQLDYFRQQQIEVNIIDPRNYGIDFLGDSLFTTEQEIAEHPERAQKFLRASLKGWDYALKHSEEIIQLILKKYNPNNRLTAQHLRFEAAETVKMIVPDIIPLGSVSVGHFQRIAELYLHLGMVKSLDNLQGFIYQSEITTKLNLSPEEKNWLRAHPVIRLAIDKDFQPYEATDDTGKFIGLSADYIALVEQRLGIKFKIITDKPWAQMLDMAKRGEIDFLSDIVQTPERNQYLLFTEPYIDIPAVIISEKNTVFRYLEDLRGKRVAVESSYFMYELLINNRPEIQVVPVKNTVEALTMVSKGIADAYIGDAASANYAISSAGMINLFSASYTDYKNRHRMAATKANPLLKSILDKALADISDHEKQTIKNRWMSLKVETALQFTQLIYYIVGTVLLFSFVVFWNMRLQREMKQRKKIQQALQRSQEEFKNLFSQAPLGIALIDSLSGRIYKANQKYADIVGLTVPKLEAITWMKITHPDDIQENLNNLVLMNAAKIKSFSMEKRLFHSNGSIVWVNLTVARLNSQIQGRPCHHCIIEDITERKQKAIEYQTVIQASLSGFWCNDFNGSFLTVNNALCQMLGYAKQELLNMKITDIEAKENSSETDAHIQTIIQTGHDTFETRHRCKDGRIIDVEINVLYVETLGERFFAFAHDITERKQAESALQQSAEQLKLVLEGGNIGFWDWNMVTNQVERNSIWAEMLGYSYEEIKHTTRQWTDFIHPEDRQKAWLSINAVLAGSKICHAEEYRMLHKDGSIRWILDHASIVQRDANGKPTRMSGTHTDITQHKQIETDLRIAAKVFDAQEGIIITGADGIILQVNQAFTEITGYSSAEAIGKSPRFLSSGRQDMVFYAQLWKTVYLSGAWQGEIWNKRKNGEVYPESLTITAVTNGDNDPVITHYVAIFTDITERKQVEQAVREAEAKAIRANQAKSEFLANMSHEIRTPMNGVIGMTHLLQRTELSEKQKNYLAKIEQSAQSLLYIINDILDFSKIEAGKLKLEQEAFLLTDVLNNLLGIVELQAQQKGIELLINQADFSEYLIGDSLRLGQILINLVSNAIKFTATGQVIISIIAETVSAQTLQLQFSVQDTGIGINGEKISQLFQSFSQADSSITRKYGGTGLGLVICKQLVEMMQGRIWVESQPGQGSTFSFSVPVEIAKTMPRNFESPCRQNNRKIPSLLSGRKILLVEDNEINRELAIELLNEFGLSVEVAKDGGEAVDRIFTEVFDLVIMDIQMPVMDGLTATRLIRADGRFNNLPIIAMTANAMTGDKETSLAAGMNDHLTKPIMPEKLTAVLTHWLTGQTEDNSAPVQISTDSAPQIVEKVVPDYLPPFNIAEALRRMNNNRKLLHKVLLMFGEEYAGSVPKLKSLILEGQYKEAKRFLHSLKGVAASLGAATLAEAVAALEQDFHEEETFAMSSRVDVLESELAGALQAVRSLEE